MVTQPTMGLRPWLLGLIWLTPPKKNVEGDFWSPLGATSSTGTLRLPWFHGQFEKPICPRRLLDTFWSSDMILIEDSLSSMHADWSLEHCRSYHTTLLEDVFFWQHIRPMQGFDFDVSSLTDVNLLAIWLGGHRFSSHDYGLAALRHRVSAGSTPAPPSCHAKCLWRPKANIWNEWRHGCSGPSVWWVPKLRWRVNGLTIK